MLDRIRALGIIWAGVIFSYILIAILAQFFVGMATDTAATMAASSDMSNYPGTLGSVQTMPYYIWFIPAVVGISASVVVLKQGERNR